jgi:hypothetical protein
MPQSATGALTPFYNPRSQAWSDHFRLEETIIQPLTPEATSAGSSVGRQLFIAFTIRGDELRVISAPA